MLERISEGLDTHGVVLLTAGDGFGKTTLLSDYARQHDTAWLSLDSRDDDPQTVLVAIIESLATVLEGFGVDALVAAGNPTTGGLELAFRLAVQELESLDRKLTIVVDDIDVLTDPTIRAGFRRIVRYRPEWLRIVMSTRDEAVVDSERLAQRGLTAVLREDDLAFSSDETAAVVRALHPAAEDVTVAALHRASGGWPAGVVLSAHRSQHDKPVFDVRALPVAQFLRRATLDWIGEDLGSFLLDVCVLGTVTPDLAEAATGRSDALVLLRELQQRHILDPPVTDDPPTWVVAPVVRDFGRHELKLTDPRRSSEVAMNAAWYQVEQGDPDAGLATAIASGDLYGCTRLLLSVHLRVSLSGRGGRVHQVATMLLDRGQHYPELSLAGAWGALGCGHDEVAEGEVRTAEATSVGGQRGRFIRAEAAAIRSHLLRRQGRFSESLAAVERARSLLADTEASATWDYADSVRTRGSLDLGIAQFCVGTLDEAVESLGASLAGDPSRQSEMIAHSFLALIAWLEGQDDPSVHAGLARLMEQRAGGEPDLAHATTALTIALSDPTPVGARALTDAELVSAGGHGVLLLVLVRVARGVRLAQQWPTGEPPDGAYEAGEDPSTPDGALEAAAARIRSLPESGILPRFVDRARSLAGHATHDESYGEALTDAEARVLRAMAGPLTEREIANELHLSHNTVRTYRRRIYRKLGVSSRRDAVAAGRRAGIG